MAPARGNIWVLGAIGALGAAYGIWLFAESFVAPAGCCGATWPLPNPMQQERLIEQQDPQGRDGARQRAAALNLVRSQPGEVSGWLRLAYADRLLHGHLTAEGQNALDISYSITPYAGPRAIWRVMFILNNWTGAPDRVKQDAIEEITILKSDPDHKFMLRQQTPTVTDPNGRITAALFGVLPLPGLDS